MDSAARLKIGISACFMHADPARPVFSSKTLQFVEQSIAHWVMSTGALAVMVPSPSGPTQRGDVTLAHYAHWLDGLVLHGGADVSPLSYGEQPLQDRWSGDRIRDEYEIELVAAFERHGKPVFGVCRGLQEINVAFGGTLRRDMGVAPDLIAHHAADDVDFDAMFDHVHEVTLAPGGVLVAAFGTEAMAVNSVHYQGVDCLGAGLHVEARAADGVVEAFSTVHHGAPVVAVQWHPEWHADANPQSQIYFHLLGRALRGEPIEGLRA